MSVFMMRAVSSAVQFAGVAEEKAKPGSEGMMMSKETVWPADFVAAWVRFATRGRNSRKEPGQPWKRMRGIAPDCSDFSWMKWMVWFSIVVVKWWKLLVGQKTGCAWCEGSTC